MKPLSPLAESFIGTNSDRLPAAYLSVLRERLSLLDESSLSGLVMLQTKQPIISLLLSIFLGVYGVDRFYMGQTKFGMFKLLTGVLGFLVWYVGQVGVLHGLVTDQAPIFSMALSAGGVAILIFWLLCVLVDIFLVFGATKRINRDRIDQYLLTLVRR